MCVYAVHVCVLVVVLRWGGVTSSDVQQTETQPEEK